MDTPILEIILHMGYHFQRTGKLIIEHFKRNWRSFLVEEIVVGLCFAFGGSIWGYFIMGTEINPSYLLGSSVFGMLIWVVILAIGSFIKAPSSLFFEQKKAADLYTWNDVYIEPYKFPNDSKYGAAFMVRTDKEHMPTASAQIVEIQVGRGVIEHPPIQLPYVYYEDQALQNFNAMLYKNKNSAKFIIAGWDNTSVWLESQNTDRQPHSPFPLEKGIEYKLRIRLSLNREMPKPKDLKYTLICNENANGELEIHFEYKGEYMQ